MAKGFTVGAHSIDHPPFTEISGEEQTRQVVESIRAVDTWFAPAHKLFAFPFSADGPGPDLLDRINRAMRVDAYFGTGLESPRPGRPILGRLPVESHASQSAARALKDYYKRNIVCRLRGAKS